MKPVALTISGFSTARYATWFCVEEASLLLDAGDGLVAALLHKAAGIKTVAISHADRDHLSGLLHYLQLFGRGEMPRIGFPKNSGSFPALAEFSGRFDPQQPGRPTWVPLEDGMEMPLGAGLVLRASVNRHVPAEPGEIKSLSYALVRKSRKLKEEFRSLSGPEIAALHSQAGRDAITVESEETQLIYSADTPIEPAQRWGRTRILMHEATFLDRDTAELRHQLARHSVLSDVLDLAAEMQPESLILTHFSTRYSNPEIARTIAAEARKRRIPFPVHAVLPGETAWNILGQPAVYSPGD